MFLTYLDRKSVKESQVSRFINYERKLMIVMVCTFESDKNMAWLWDGLMEKGMQIEITDEWMIRNSGMIEERKNEREVIETSSLSSLPTAILKNNDGMDDNFQQLHCSLTSVITVPHLQ